MPLRGPETLESRRTAAVLVYTDVDGDTVKISSSKGTTGQLWSALTFHAAGQGQEIQRIDLSSMPTFQGAALTVAVTSKKGDGHADVGEFIATGLDLASLTVDGNLSAISAGDSNLLTPGIGVLKVGSFSGRDWGQGLPISNVVGGGTNSFQVLGDASDDVISFEGTVGQILVSGSMKDTYIGAGSINTLVVSGDVLQAGSSNLCGVFTHHDLGKATINGSILGGRVESKGHIGTIKVFGSVIGNWNANSGAIRAGNGIDSVYVKYNVAGWAGDRGGCVDCLGDLGTITIGGSVKGSNGSQSGRVFASHKIGFIKVKHDVVGGAGWQSGTIQSQTSIVDVRIEGGLVGGSGDQSGRIESFVAIAHAAIDGGVKGGSGEGSGALASFGNIFNCFLYGDVQGGTGPGSGQIVAGGNLTSKGYGSPYAIYLKGSLIGGIGDKSGSISAESIVGTALVFKSVMGGSGYSSGSIRASKSIGKVIIGGSLVSGGNDDTGSIRAGDSLGTLDVSGNVVGNATYPVLITAAGLVNPDAITTITVKHGVSNALILAGYNNSTIPYAVSGAARLGTVTVSTNLVASSIVAGAQVPAFLGNGAPYKPFGTIWDVPIGNNKASIIGKVIVGGGVFGTAAAGDHFGIVGGWIGTVMVGGKKVALPDPGDVTPLGGQTDVKVHVLS